MQHGSFSRICRGLSFSALFTLVFIYPMLAQDVGMGDRKGELTASRLRTPWISRPPMFPGPNLCLEGRFDCWQSLACRKAGPLSSWHRG